MKIQWNAQIFISFLLFFFAIIMHRYYILNVLISLAFSYTRNDILNGHFFRLVFTSSDKGRERERKRVIGANLNEHEHITNTEANKKQNCYAFLFCVMRCPIATVLGHRIGWVWVCEKCVLNIVCNFLETRRHLLHFIIQHNDVNAAHQFFNFFLSLSLAVVNIITTCDAHLCVFAHARARKGLLQKIN